MNENSYLAPAAVRDFLNNSELQGQAFDNLRMQMEKIIEKVVKGDIDKNVLMEYLIDDFDCEKIYDSDEELITDAFFTLKHYASGEEEVSKDEWMYFLECLAGKREYNMEAKMSITTKPPHRQA